jgi:hypothetical protein
VGDGKPDSEDRIQPDRSGRDQFLRLCFAGGPVVAPPRSQRRRRAFSLSVEFDVGDGGLCRACYCDLRTAVAEPADTKEVI